MWLLLMRHGEPSCQAPSDRFYPLSHLGQKQVQAQIFNEKIDWQGYRQLWTSPYLRTRQTTQIVMDNLANIVRQNIATSTLIMPNNDCDQVQAWLVR